jgi:RimJ/RimL family protein N-acetyltransferase
MIIPEIVFSLKDGRKALIRSPRDEDIPGMLEYLYVSAGETEFILRYPEECGKYTPEGEKEILGRLLDAPDSAMLVAVVDGKVAGNSAINSIGTKRKICHRCSLAIALYKEYWNLGIGTAMIGYLTELAKQIGYRQIDLEVVAENTQAQALYRKCGFTESGRRINALRFDDGSFHDEILMYKSL